MPQSSTAPALVHDLPRNVYSRPYGHGKRIYFSVQSDGTEGRWRVVPDTGVVRHDIIVALADALDRDDPQMPPSSRHPAWLSRARVIPLYRER